MKKLWYRIFGRLNRMGLIDWIPDELFLKIDYYGTFGKKLDLKNPRTYNEKLQWLKVYNRKPEYTKMVDKYEAKKLFADIVGEDHVIPLLGVWKKFDDIDFAALPEQFVLKCTHDSGSVIICRNKNEFDIDEARIKIQKALAVNCFRRGREWPYKNVKPRIIAEKYMEDSSGKCLRDYKFYCFNGAPRFLSVSEGLENFATAFRSFLTLEWKPAPFSRSGFNEYPSLPSKPESFNQMISIAKTVSTGIPFLRVDFYEIDSTMFIGETTFFPGGGYQTFSPEEWDLRLGEWITLPDISSSDE